jgi:hypothetical protein
MNRDRADAKSHATAWTIALLFVPVLYVLSVPPVLMVTDRVAAPSMDPFAPLPTWPGNYGRPYRWLHDNTPLKTPLTAYERMWGKYGIR